MLSPAPLHGVMPRLWEPGKSRHLTQDLQSEDGKRKNRVRADLTGPSEVQAHTHSIIKDQSGGKG